MTVGVQDIHEFAQELQSLVHNQRTQHGVYKVDLMVRSQGGLMAWAYVKW